MRKSELKELLKSHGLSPRKALGQNFCCDPNLLEAIVRDADLQDDELALEVGVGTAALTRVLAQRARRVVGIEIDNGLFALSEALLADEAHIRIVHTDALKTKNELSPALVEAVNEALGAEGIAGLKLVANLPYAVATPLLLLILEAGWPLRGATVLVQKEAAEKFLARPGQEGYGAVSVLMQLQARGKILRTLPKEVFHPRPKIASAVLQLTPLEPEASVPAARFPLLKRLVRQLFHNRRKTLAKASKIAAKSEPALAGLSEVIAASELDAQRRVDEITPEGFRELADALAGEA